MTSRNKVADFDRTSDLTFLARWLFGESDETIGTARRLKDETTVDLSNTEKEEFDRKTDRQDLTNEKRAGTNVFSKTVGTKTDRELSLSVEVERMESELFEDETNLLTLKELVFKLEGSGSTNRSNGRREVLSRGTGDRSRHEKVAERR